MQLPGTLHCNVVTAGAGVEQGCGWCSSLRHYQHLFLTSGCQYFRWIVRSITVIWCPFIRLYNQLSASIYYLYRYKCVRPVSTPAVRKLAVPLKQQQPVFSATRTLIGARIKSRFKTGMRNQFLWPQNFYSLLQIPNFVLANFIRPYSCRQVCMPLAFGPIPVAAVISGLIPLSGKIQSSSILYYMIMF